MRSAGEVVGFVLMVVGVIALLGSLGTDAGLTDALGWLWPLLVVGFGLWLVWDAGNRRYSMPRPGWSARGPDRPPGGPDAWGSGADALPGADSSGAGLGTRAVPGTPDPAGWPAASRAWGPGVLHDRRFLGEIEMAGPVQAGPMHIETFIGEVRLDLTQATFPDGETPIHVSTAVGEVRVLLPADVAASVRATSMLGESEALGRTSGAVMGDVRAETDDYSVATRRIRVEAQSLIGEVAVRRARPSAGLDPLASPGSGSDRPPAPPDGHAESEWAGEAATQPPAAQAESGWAGAAATQPSGTPGESEAAAQPPAGPDS